MKQHILILYVKYKLLLVFTFQYTVHSGTLYHHPMSSQGFGAQRSLKNVFHGNKELSQKNFREQCKFWVANKRGAPTLKELVKIV